VHLSQILQRERLTADEVAFVGDEQRDLAAARSCGCHFIGVRNGLSDFDPHGLLVLDDLRALESALQAHGDGSD
jgi:phosphoglycolate phosphatase-like HAD superfamily hydrolase